MGIGGMFPGSFVGGGAGPPAPVSVPGNLNSLVNVEDIKLNPTRKRKEK